MSAESLPTFAYRQELSSAQDDTNLVPVNTPVGWLYLTVTTTGPNPEEVEQAIQFRLGSGPWLVFTTPIALSGLKLKALGCPQHTGGVNIRTPALAGLQLIAQGGGA